MNQTAAKPALPDAQTVTSVKHWTDRLFSFRVTRPASLRFRSGEFVMIGLMGDADPKTGKQKPLLRAYSIASPAWDDELEFYSIKVQDGPLTSRLQHIAPDDQIILPQSLLARWCMTRCCRANGCGFLQLAPDLRLLHPCCANQRPMKSSKRSS